MHDSGSDGKRSIHEVEKTRQHKLKTERLRRKDTWQKKIQATIGVDKPQAARRTGIDIVGDVPWGTHLCVFYQDKQDLIDILVPYFKAGLENNEFCMWITSAPLNTREAEESLRQAVNNLSEYVEKGQIEILDYSQWYTKSGSFDADEVLQGWNERYEQAVKRGFDGLRATGNALWLEKRDWIKITRYEAMANDIIGDCRMLAICTYPLNKCGTSEAIDVVCNHRFVLIRREGRWELVESSELKNTNRILQNTLKQWETTFNTTQDSIILIDPDFTILKANLATSNLLGKPLDDIPGSKCYELFHGTNEAPDICPHKRVKKTKKHEEAELHIPDKDIWIAISIDPILDDSGNMSGTVHVVRNITEPKHTKEALKRSELRFRSLIEQTTEAVFCYEYDPPIPTDLPIEEQVKLLHNGLLVECNDVCAKSYGAQRADEVIGKRLTELFRTTPASLDKLFTDMINGGYRIVDGEGVEKLEDGTTRHHLNNGYGVIEDGKLIRVWGTFRDITARKRAEKALRENQERMRSLLELSPDLIIIVNPDNTIQFINRVAIGNSVEQVIGKSVCEFVESRYHSDLRKALSQTFATGQNCSLVVRGIYQSGKMGWFENRLAPIKQNGLVSAVMVVCTDITKRRQAEEELKQSREFLANTINALDDSFFVKDEEHRWTIFNDAACKAIGRPMEELIGKSDYDFFPKEQADVFWEKDNLVFETGETSINEEEITWQGKLHTISTKKSLFKDSITGKRFIVGTVRDITERKQMEKTLRESEQKYRALVEHSLYGIVILQDFRIVFANAAAMDIAGLTIDEARSLTLEDMMAFIPPENRATALEQLKNRFAGKDEPGNYVLRLVRRNGEEFWLNLFFSNIEYQGKHAIQLAFADITDQKRMEEALRRSEKRFRDIFENTAVGIYRTTPDGRILMANPAIVHMLGYSSFEGLNQRNLEEEGFEPQYLRSRFKEEIELKGRIVSWESIWTTKDGKKLYVIENARAVKDEDDKIMYYEGTAENITERKKAEEALIESEEKFRNLAEQSPNMIFITNKRGRVVYANKQCEEAMGYKREEFYHPDFDFMTLIAPEFSQLIKTNFSKHMNGEEIKPYEYGLITKDGERLNTIITTKLIKYDGEDSILGIITDITERKQAQEEITKLAKFPAEDPNPVLRISKDGTILYANNASSVVLDTWDRQVGERLPVACRGRMEEVFSSVTASTFEFQCNNGKIFEVKLAPIAESGYANAYGLDITERKKAEEALRESEEQLRLAVQAAQLSTWNWDLLTDEVCLGGHSSEVLGLAPDSKNISGSYVMMEIINPEDLGRSRQAVKKAINERTLYKDEYRIVRPDGTERWIAAHGQPLYDKTGKAVRMIGANQDITERKNAEEKLKIREQTLRAFLNAPTESAILVDTKGTILDINRIAAKRLGQSAEGLIGMNIYDYLPADIAENRKARGAEVIRSGKPLRFQDERAGRYYDSSIYPVFDDEEKVSAIGVFSRDITENKKAEKRLLKYQEQLKSLASELTLAEERERRRIATDLHDEISQSLFISKMKLEALHKSVSDKQSDDTLDEISNSLGRILAAMRSLTFDLSSPILYEFGFEEAVAEWLNERVGKKYGIETEFEDDGLTKPLDDDIRVLLFRNVRELLINVVKHARAKKIKVSIQKVDRRIRICVEDDGLGFDSDKAESMVTDKKAFGLFSIRERLEHLGGNLDIKTAPGCGCRITITSPLKREDFSEGKRV